MSDNDNLPDPIKSLAEAIEKKGAKVQFGLKQQGHIDTIERILNKWNDFPEGCEYKSNMIYSKHVWEEIGREIGWCPLTAALHYFSYLDKNENG